MDKMTKKFPWGNVLIVAYFAGLIMLVAILGVNHDLIEGEVLGKEPRQAAFLGGTPNYLIINGTGKVVVDVELFHGYEVGEWFSEDLSWSHFGGGRELSTLIPLSIMVGVIMLIFSMFSRATMGRY